jgi:hypothetical protein
MTQKAAAGPSAMRNRSLGELGVLALLVVLAGATSAHATPITVVNAGFEAPATTAGSSSNGLPTAFGSWQGDASEIVGGQNGIVPFEASRMLHFISSANPTGQDGLSSDIWQLVDMSPYAAVIAAGQATVTWSAFFNRILGDAQTEAQFAVSVRAFAGLPAAFVSISESPLADSTSTLFTDGNPVTWQQISASLLLPTATTYVGVQVASRETLNDSPFAFEFAGHYADQTTLTLDDIQQPQQVAVPEPTSLLLVGFGVAALSLRRSRQRRPR